MATRDLATAALVLSLAAALVPSVVCAGYYGSPPPAGYYGGKSPSVFLNRPDLILPPVPSAEAPAPGPTAVNFGWTPQQPSPPLDLNPSCSVYARSYSTGTNTGHLSMIVSNTADVNFESPFTLVFANPSLTGVNAYNTNNSPSTVTLGDGGIVTSVVTSSIPAQNSNTFEYDLSSSAPDANFNPSGAYMPQWVSVNGVGCGIVTGF